MKNENDDDLIEICDSENGNCSGMGPANDSMHDRTGIQIKAELQFNRENEDSRATTIEIFGSDDEECPFETQTNADANGIHTKVNDNVAAVMENLPQNNWNDTQTEAADENEVKPFVKSDPDANNAIEMVDIPLVEFDPNVENSDAVAGNGTGESSSTQQTNRSMNIGSNQLEVPIWNKALLSANASNAISVHLNSNACLI